jgi:sporulation protein YlmC with PRC-barrel domain
MLSLVLLWVGGCAHVTAQPVIASPPAELTTEQLSTYDVVRGDGTPIGPEDGIVVDTETGQVEYLIVLLKDKYNFGKGADQGPQDQYLLIPWSLVRFDIAHGRLIAAVDSARLDAAPILDELPDTTQPDWDAAIRDYWAAR